MKTTLNILLIMTFTSISITISAQCVQCDENCNASGNYASVIGMSTTATGEGAFAGGLNSQAMADYSFAFGKAAKASDESCFAIGDNTEANGLRSFSMGFHSIANGDAAFALGFYNHAQAGSSYLFGEFLKSVASGNVIIGSGAGVGDNYLLNGVPNSLMIGFQSKYPTLFIGKSPSDTETGKIGIGNITENLQAKLHIKADLDEDAAIMLEPTGTTNYAKIFFGNNDNRIEGKEGEGLKFITQTDQNFIFNNGNIIQEEGFDLLTSTIKPAGTNGINLFNNNDEGITITNDKVLISTNQASHKLEVNANSYFNGYIELSAGNYLGTTNIFGIDESGLKLTNQNNSGILIDVNGNVGIGTVDPQEALEVNGKIKSSGSNSAIILESPDGTEWEIKVDNNGNLTTNQIAMIPEKHNQYDIKIFPNPATNTISIEIQSDKIHSFDAEIYDLNGKMIFMRNYKTNNSQIDVNNFSKGIYILNIKGNNGTLLKSEKIAIE